MAAKLGQIHMGEIILEELRDQIKRIPGRFQEHMQGDPRRQMVQTHEGRYKAWDFPGATFHDLKMKIK